jgi:hypothetical protein
MTDTVYPELRLSDNSRWRQVNDFWEKWYDEDGGYWWRRSWPKLFKHPELTLADCRDIVAYLEAREQEAKG